MNNKILEEANKLIKNENLNSTYIDGINLYKISKFIPKVPLTYDVCLIILLQGQKIVHLANHQEIKYDKDNYLVVPVTLPVECESFASEDEPIIAMFFNIDKMLMLDVISSIEDEKQNSNETSMAIFSGEVTLDIQDVVYRILKVLQSKEESKVLGKALLTELYYRVAVGKNASFLNNMFLEQKKETKIARSLKEIHSNYNKQLDVNSLAKQEDLSLSSYHRYFKQITSYSPLQYIKKIRLNKAKDLIEKENFQVNDTAYEVGYVSVSQFSRDFKNYFGFPPKEAKVV